MEFKGQLGQYKIISTEDNTQTVWSEFFDEACHNLSGAYEETLHNYIAGCALESQIKKHGYVHVLDVGFGVGIGLLAVLDLLKNFPPRLSSTYTSIELDETFFLWSVENTFKHHPLQLTREESPGVITYRAQIDQLSLVIFIGDGRKTLPLMKASLPGFTAIFQDAFSPKKNPALWSVEWFRLLKELSSDEVLLSTYSSSISIRKSLIKAGWNIESARGFGQKRTMTKGNLQKETDPELLLSLNKSPILEIVDN